VSLSRLSYKYDYIKAKLEEGYSFRFLSEELGVSHQTLINYVKGLNGHYKRIHVGIDFRKPLTPRDLAQRQGVSICLVRNWLREGRIKGRKVGHRWIIVE
jgi:transposase